MTPYFDDGQCVIYHGDCREILPGLWADVLISDPPYGVGARYGDSYSDSSQGYWEWFLPVVALMRAAAPVVAFTHRIEALRWVSGWDWVAVWHKPLSLGGRIGNSRWLPHWEPIFLWGIHGVKAQAVGDVLSFNPEVGSGTVSQPGRTKLASASVGHPFPKPERLFRRLIDALSVEEQTILDPFMGSGTTLRAAKDLGRRAIGIEIDERYYEIAARRLSQQVLPLEVNA